MNDSIARRTLLASALSSAAALAIGPLLAQEKASATGEMITRTPEPVNLESPSASLQTFITPNERFYVRNHFKQPSISADSWKLKVEGAVARPQELSYRDLLAMPTRTQTVMFECAGNGRLYLVPKEGGVQWLSGAAGNAAWTGVPLLALLQKAGVKSSAVDVMFEGADAGELTAEPKTPGEIHFARSVSMAKVHAGNVLLAYKMNGADLPAAHGYPLRVVVPGWYGMASVKWLTRIVVSDKPFEGFFQTMQYSHWERPNGVPTMVPITEMHAKAIVTAPAPDESIARGAAYKIQGAAWGGEADIAQVEVSTDGGQQWSKAKLAGPAVHHAWRLWEFAWQAPAAGSYTIMARATDSKGAVQPMERARDFRNYEIRHVVPVKVTVS